MASINENSVTISPLIKWAGGKKRLAAIIEKESQKQFDFSTIDTYVEPFAGGASVFLYLATKYNFKRKVLLDVNPALINLYVQVRDNVTELMQGLEEVQQDYNRLSDVDLSDKKAYFYSARQQFNNELITHENPLKEAVLFMLLNKTDFNGLYRVNSKGLFNVPFGQRKKINLYDEDNLKKYSELLQNTEILLGDYHDTLKYAGENTFFYFDPPYRPLSDSASFTSYAKSSFNDDSQVELANYVKTVAQKGAHFTLSNSDPHQSEESDDFFDDLYSKFTITRIQAARMISAKARGRGNVSELLITH